VPAAFLLILQQVLLMGASMLTVVALAQPVGGAFASVLGRGVAHLTIYLPALALYLIVLPRFYGFSALGQPLQLLALASVFTLATSFMGQAAGAWFKNPETPTLILPWDRPAAVFPNGFLLAARSHSQGGAACGLDFPVKFRDRRHRSHRSAGGQPVGGGARLARPVGSRCHLFLARCDFSISGQTEAGACLRADANV
jgi:ABC-2 type transport system permease protein